MDGESSHQDYKLTFDFEDSEAKLNLVKDVIAMANAGGGEIIFGRNETDIRGIEIEVAKALDSAKVADLAGKFAKPANLNISHEDSLLENGRVLHTVRVAAAEYPIVMADIGNYSHNFSFR
jgi:predicted HTH transcriptional regulator